MPYGSTRFLTLSLKQFGAIPRWLYPGFDLVTRRERYVGTVRRRRPFRDDPFKVTLENQPEEVAALGFFLDVGERRIFIPQFFSSTLIRRYELGEIVTVNVLRSFGEQKELIA